MKRSEVIMKKTNYHTHTERCYHAWGIDEEYVQAAIEGGYKELGFSDHACWKYDSDFVAHMRMPLSNFDDYYESVSRLKEKYKDQIKILIGMECEYYPKYMDWMQEFIKEKKLDYVILGNHYDITDELQIYYGSVCNDDKRLKRYIDSCIEGMSTGIYSYLAHPDLFMRSRKKFDDLARSESYRLCKWCKENNVVLEYNLEGYRMGDERKVQWYPHPEFWKIAAEVGNDVIIGVDAHYTESLSNDHYYKKALEQIETLGLNRIKELPLRW